MNAVIVGETKTRRWSIVKLNAEDAEVVNDGCEFATLDDQFGEVGETANFDGGDNILACHTTIEVALTYDP
jgi:hypothetical protein